MKTLFIGFNARYINPTNSLLPSMLAMIADVDFYGPGFCSDEVLSQGLESFAEKNGPYDFVFTTTQVAVNAEPISTKNFYDRYSVKQWGRYSISLFLHNAHTFMNSYKGNRVTFVLDLDPYAVQKEELNKLNRSSDFLVGLGKGFTKQSEKLEFLLAENDIRKKSENRTLGLWHEFAIKNRQKFINLGHFVCSAEFSYRPFGNRMFDVSVPGQLYSFRSSMKEDLEKSCLKVGWCRHKLIFRLLDKMKMRPYARRLTYGINQNLYRNMLASSKICVTDGGAYDFWVRKYVEIPASGAVIAARPCVGFEDMGFEHGKNCIALTTQNNVASLKQCLSDEELLETIAFNGQKMILDNHSIFARSTQLKKALMSIKANRFNGSYWKSGEFKIEEAVECNP